MALFGFLASIFGVLGLLVGIKPITSYLDTGFVTFIPSTILAASLIMIAIFFVLSGLNMDHAKHIRQLQEEILYQQKK